MGKLKKILMREIIPKKYDDANYSLILSLMVPIIFTFGLKCPDAIPNALEFYAGKPFQEFFQKGPSQIYSSPDRNNNGKISFWETVTEAVEASNTQGYTGHVGYPNRN